ncbi:MAG: serine/threonine protein kinase [Planctomycetales bacterium]|nr:serine/threonine protein kinase [Planctomycetales bacterium]
MQNTSEQLTTEQQDRLAELLDRCFETLEQGGKLDRDALHREHPDLATSIDAYLEGLTFLQNAAAGFHPAPAFAATHDEPQRIGEFRVVRELGRGGMGIVYEAVQESLGRRVALKVLPFASLLSSTQIARFRNEAQAAARVDHPHIVPVHMVGTDRGLNYYVMQLIEGAPWDRILAKLSGEPVPSFPSCPSQSIESPAKADQDVAVNGSAAQDACECLATLYESDFPEYCRRVAAVGADIAEALQAAHDQSIIHRDVKPSNLLLDTQGRVWITDFGLARCRPAQDLTGTRDMIGTLRYMSPEQASGDQWVDHRADIYSLGATLYEMLTLHPAVRGSGPAEMLRSIERETPYRPRLWNPAISRDLENVVLRAIAKAPEDRYPTCRELARDLRRFVAGEPTLARPPSWLEQAMRWTRRHYRGVTFALAACVVLAAGLSVASLWLSAQGRRAELALSEAKRHQRAYQLQLAKADLQAATLHRQVGQLEPAGELLARALQSLRALAADASDGSPDHRQLAAALNAAAMACPPAEAKQAQALLAEALLAQQGDVGPEAARQNALTRGNLGSWHGVTGEWRLAAEHHAAAVAALRELHRALPNSREQAALLATALNNLGRAAAASGSKESAERSLTESLEVLSPFVEPEAPAQLHSLQAGAHYNLAELLADRDAVGADEHSRSAVEIQRHALQLAPNLPGGRELLGSMLLQQSRTARQRGHWSDAVAAADDARRLRPAHADRALRAARELAAVFEVVQSRPGSEQTASRSRELALLALDEAIQMGAKPSAEEFAAKDMTWTELRDLRQAPSKEGP